MQPTVAPTNHQWASAAILFQGRIVSRMKLLTFLFNFCVLLACLEKAIAGPGTSGKRKRDESSDEWADWSVNLATKNQLPASLAKINIEKANKSGAKGLTLPGKKGKTTNAARTMRRARKRTSKPNFWPSCYWAKIPMRDPKTNQKKDMWHCFLLPHEWLASLWQDPCPISLYAQTRNQIRTCFAPIMSMLGLACRRHHSLWTPWRCCSCTWHYSKG